MHARAARCTLRRQHVRREDDPVPQSHQRVILDRPVMLTARSAHPGPANPFAPENFRVPLLLVLHTASLQAQAGAIREEVELLASLGHSPYADIWLTAGEQTFGDEFAQAQPGVGVSEDSLHRLPVSVDYDAGRSRFRAHVGDWSRWRRRVDDKYPPEDRERTRDAYAGALLTVVANRHAFVTCDRLLLAERGEHPWADVNILDVREAIALVGLLMRQRGRCDLHYDQEGPFERSAGSRLYTELTATLSEHARGILDAVDAAGQLNDATVDLMFSAEDRINDLLVSRDGIRVASLLPHGGAMLTSALYHLRAAVQSAAALLDSLAVLACERMQIPSDPLTVTFRRPTFRQALADAGATSLAAVIGSQRYLALAFFINELRGPIGHGRGVRGVTDLSAREVTSHLRISGSQTEKLRQAYGQRRERAAVWGIHPDEPSLLDIDIFADKFTQAVIEAFDETVIALTADLRRRHPGPSPLMQAWQEGQDRLAEIRARMPAEQRDAIHRREGAQEDAERGYSRRTLRAITLYAGLADWRLLELLTAARIAP